MSTTNHRLLTAAAAIAALAATQVGCVVQPAPYRHVVVYSSPPPPPPQPPATVVVAETEADVAEDDFREPLSNYGVWIYDARYGYVWQPAPDMAGPDFVPYASHGSWVVNEDGDWVFVSRYHRQWGWATYHYGRWVWNDVYGWVWLPGRRWAPAWVEWRYGGGYVGWAPMGPPGVVVVQHRWVFVAQGHVSSSNVLVHRVTGDGARAAYVAATPIAASRGSGKWRSGPPPSELRSAGVAINMARVTAPERGHVRAQGRASIDAAAERRSAGLIVTTPHARPGAAPPGDMVTDPRMPSPGTPPPLPPPAPAGGGISGPPSGPAPLPTAHNPYDGGHAPSPNGGPRPVNPFPDPAPTSRPDTRPVNPFPDPAPTSRPDTRPVNPFPTPAPSTRPSHPTPIPAPSPGPSTRPSHPTPIPAPSPGPSTRPSHPTPIPAPVPRPTARPTPAPVPAPVPKPAAKPRPKPKPDKKRN